MASTACACTCWRPASRAGPALLLLHGFPELAYSWRKLMPPLAAAGYHVLAPDQRGYGRSSGFSTDYDADLQPFGLRNLVRDAVALLDALGIARVAAVVGHDFGSPVAAWCALLHPERFASVVLMSAPFGGPPPAAAAGADDIHAALAALPRPRKHYQRHYGTREANPEMWHAPQGVHDFLRAYYHMKSADWAGNQPYELQGWRADELAKMPEYYVMDLRPGHGRDRGRRTCRRRRRWRPAPGCTDAELAVYAAEYARTGFQGGLQWYRCSTHPPCVAELQRLPGARIDVPACFIAGASDWGMFQKPGELQRMRARLHAAARRAPRARRRPLGAAGAARGHAAAAAGLPGRRMTPLPLNDLFKLAPGPVPALMFVRVVLAVGVPMIGFTLAGQPLAAVAAGATAMFVTLCDVGRSTPSRTAMMLLGTRPSWPAAWPATSSAAAPASTRRWSSPRPSSPRGSAIRSRGWPWWRATARWPPRPVWACRSPTRWRPARSSPAGCGR